MKRSRRLRSSAALVALAALTSSCSFLRLQNDVAVKAVPIDLTFGASIPPAATPSVPPPAVIVPPPPTLPPLPPTPPEPSTPPEPVFPCPEHPTALGARDPSTPDIAPEQAPKEGVYLYRFQGQYGGPNAQLSTIIGYKTVSNVQTVDATLGSFSFQIEDPFNHIVLVLLAKPISDTDPLDGLFLQEIDIPSTNPALGTDPLKFVPAQPLRMIDFPIEPGTNQTFAGIDTGQKPAQAGGGALPALPSADTISSNFTVGESESVDVCADIAKAFKGNWEIKISGQYNADLVGTFWIDTAYGGLPVKDDYTLTSDTLETGNFSSNLMRLDPVKFI